MTVYALIVTPEFGYEMQVYERTLTRHGMKVKFSSVRDGRRLKDVAANLIRVRP